MENHRKIAILFVCTGNICRSPTAEGVMRRRLAMDGLSDRVTVASAGTHGYHVGEAPDIRAVEAARYRGVDLSALRARRVDAEDIQRYDLVLAMDRDHLDFLRRLAPPALRDRVQLFLDYAPDHKGHDVPDPYYGAEDQFDVVLDLIEAAADGLLDEIHRRLERSAA
ncbi:low molecular weight protein-tyrosine-phosphatase [Azospirillum sp. B4]|uniref:low molecular weight protein-tyrosine-phosphatase n=1 Tax=Azospirillum sp. B4 TaxID=95605 RepID=UPI000345CD93|nr:low molecular weight protein-tyrosine-phosphatase [Azospirillum sp. B4]